MPVERPVTTERPGDVQPARRLIHVAHFYEGEEPTHWLCGDPIVRVLGEVDGHPIPKGDRACPRCRERALGMDAKQAPSQFVRNPRLAFNADEADCCTCKGECDRRGDGICRCLPLTHPSPPMRAPE